MDLLLRYKNIAVLGTVIVLQLILLGYQVRRGEDTLLRTWTVGAVTPLNHSVHGSFESVSSLWNGYLWLTGARAENERLHSEVDRLRLENRSLERDLERFERVQQLIGYRERLPSRTVAAEVIGGGGNTNAREIIIDRGRAHGVFPGMAAITADGIVGKVTAAHRGSSLIMLITDVDAGVGAILGDSRVRGILKGRGDDECLLDYVAPEVRVRTGETVYTSGDDRVFPKGLPIGEVVRLVNGSDFKGIWVRPFVRLDRLDDLLVIVEGVHQDLPPNGISQTPQILLAPPAAPASPAPPDAESVEAAADATPPAEEAETESAHVPLTDADRILDRYREIGAAQGHVFGEGLPGSRPPDFNLGRPAAEPAPTRAVGDPGESERPDVLAARPPARP